MCLPSQRVEAATRIDGVSTRCGEVSNVMADMAYTARRGVVRACEAGGEAMPFFFSRKFQIAGNCGTCLVVVGDAPKPLCSCALLVLPSTSIFTTTALFLSEKSVRGGRGVYFTQSSLRFPGTLSALRLSVFVMSPCAIQKRGDKDAVCYELRK